MEKWKVHVPTEGNRITIYKCGLNAGQVVALRKDLVIQDHNGKPTGKVHKSGEQWQVLPGIKSDPVLWLLPPDGESCTWDDDPAAVNEWFEAVDGKKSD